MKTLLSFLTAVFLAGTVLLTTPTTARADVDIDFFYDSLSPYGSWMEVGDYGYVWRPEVDDEWEPYTEGHWVYTDYGWTWVSDEPYSWAVYHYGRWANLSGIGWIWVPDNEWGPAWVSWRNSPDYVGWAPLPPEAHFVVSIGFSNWVDSYYDIGPGRYRFIPVRHFGAVNLRPLFVNRSMNYTIINRTTNITNITYSNNIIVNRGPDFDLISRRSERPLQRLRLDRRRDFSGDPRSLRPEDIHSRRDGDTLRLFAPQVAARAQRPPAKITREIRDVQVNRGWRGAGIPDEEASRIRQKIKSEAKVPDALPERPRFTRPVATPKGPGPDSQTAGKKAEKGERPRITDDVPRRPDERTPQSTAERPATADRTMPAERPAPTGERPAIPQPKGDRPKAPERTERPATPDRERPTPKVERPAQTERPSPQMERPTPKMERPAMPDRERPSPKVERPAPTERPSPKVERPSPKVERPSPTERPRPQVERPALPQRPNVNVERPARPVPTPAPSQSVAPQTTPPRNVPAPSTRALPEGANRKGKKSELTR